LWLLRSSELRWLVSAPQFSFGQPTWMGSEQCHQRLWFHRDSMQWDWTYPLTVRTTSNLRLFLANYWLFRSMDGSQFAGNASLIIPDTIQHLTELTTFAMTNWRNRRSLTSAVCMLHKVKVFKIERGYSLPDVVCLSLHKSHAVSHYDWKLVYLDWSDTLLH